MKLDTDRIVSLSAMVVGVASLVIAVYQTQLARQSQHASVLPYLYFQLAYPPDAGVSLFLTNSGIGPALIDDVRVRYRGQETVADPYDFYLGLHPEVEAMNFGVDKVLPGRLIPAGATIQMIGTSVEDAERMQTEFVRLFDIAEVPKAWVQKAGATADRAVIEVIFSSVYGDRWRIRSDRLVPERM
jgi:hypothetical protein